MPTIKILIIWLFDFIWNLLFWAYFTLSMYIQPFWIPSTEGEAWRRLLDYLMVQLGWAARWWPWSDSLDPTGIMFDRPPLPISSATWAPRFLGQEYNYFDQVLLTQKLQGITKLSFSFDLSGISPISFDQNGMPFKVWNREFYNREIWELGLP